MTDEFVRICWLNGENKVKETMVNSKKAMIFINTLLVKGTKAWVVDENVDEVIQKICGNELERVIQICPAKECGHRLVRVEPTSPLLICIGPKPPCNFAYFSESEQKEYWI